MANVTCIQDWTDDTKLGCRAEGPNVEDGHEYLFLKEYLYKGETWYMVVDQSDGRNIHAPKSKFA